MNKNKNIGCDECHWQGFNVKGSGVYAKAELCICVQNCKECTGTGTLLSKNEKGYSYVTPCQICSVIRRNVKLYNMAGVPAKYHDVLQVGTRNDEDGVSGGHEER